MRPFEGIRVIDMTHVLAGPFSTYQLAVLGADVIKIEAPNGPDMTRDEGVIDALNEQYMGTYFLAQSAGKRSITLDLKTGEGREILKKLVATADVLAENYRAGKLSELGLGYEDLSKINPQLIYCSMTGFGQTGPKAQHPAYDVVIQAYSGLMAANGEADSQPVRVGPPVVDYGTGAQAGMAISAALYQRTHTGRGQHIDVAMLDAAMMMMSSPVTDTMCTGEAPKPHGNIHPKYTAYAAYPAKDGMLMIGAYTTRQVTNLMNALGQDALAEEISVMSRPELRAAGGRIKATLEELLPEKPAQEWEDLLNSAGVPAARVRTMQEALQSDQVAARPVFQDHGGTSGEGETTRLPVAAFAYAHNGPKIDRPPPRMGEHTDEVLEELGMDNDEIAELRAAGVI